MKIKKSFITGIIFISAFILWTISVLTIDVQPVGQNGTDIGFATLNYWFNSLTGVNMTIYNITDWLGLVPVFCCMFFGLIGFIQLIKRKSLLKVDFDIIVLGIYYVIIILGYLIFETIPINYRPILIDGRMEVSYPSSTTLLVLSVMPSVKFQADRRIKNNIIRKIINILIIIFSLFMVIGRTVSGVHWLSDIIGAVFISIGLYMFYKSTVLLWDEKNKIISECE